MTLHIVDTDGHWMTSPDWRRVVDIALYQAARTGFRYRVRHSYARPGHWLVARIVPNQRVRNLVAQ